MRRNQGGNRKEKQKLFRYIPQTAIAQKTRHNTQDSRHSIHHTANAQHKYGIIFICIVYFCVVYCKFAVLCTVSCVLRYSEAGWQLERKLMNPTPGLYRPHNKLHTPHYTLYTPHNKLHTQHSALNIVTPNSTLICVCAWRGGGPIWKPKSLYFISILVIQYQSHR